MTLVSALVIEIFNAFVLQWWVYSNPWTFIMIIYIWALLGVLLASLNRKEMNWAAGLVFSVWGLIVETLNLLFFNEWYFPSATGLIGTYIFWILFGVLLYCICLVSSKLSNKVTRSFFNSILF